MRARQLKPGFFKNDLLAELPPLTRILFEGLWCLGDRAGRLEYRPKRIKAEVLPFDECDIDAMMTALRDKQFIIMYSVGGMEYVQVEGFERHQNPHKQERESVIPPPVQVPKKHRIKSEVVGLTPSSLTPSSLTPSNSGSSEFADWYSKYPRHEGVQGAERAWGKLTESEREECARRSPSWIKAKAGTERQFFPMPATFLNGRRWRDEVVPVVVKGKVTDMPTTHEKDRATADVGKCPRCGGPNPDHWDVCRECLHGMGITDEEIESNAKEASDAK